MAKTTDKKKTEKARKPATRSTAAAVKRETKAKPVDAEVSASTRSTAPKAKKATTARKGRRKTRNTKPCRIESCKRAYRAKGYCRTHYRMWRNGKYGRARYKLCKDGVCTRPMGQARHGFCEEHYQSYYVQGVKQAKAPAAAPAAPAEEKSAVA